MARCGFTCAVGYHAPSTRTVCHGVPRSDTLCHVMPRCVPLCHVVSAIVRADVRAAVCTQMCATLCTRVCSHALDTLTLKAGLMSHSKRDTYVTQSETHVRSTFVDERHRSIIWSAASATAAVAVAAAAAAAAVAAAAASCDTHLSDCSMSALG